MILSSMIMRLLLWLLIISGTIIIISTTTTTTATATATANDDELPLLDESVNELATDTDHHHLTLCPDVCHCHGFTVDCSQRSLTSLPKHIPLTVRELRLEQNMIRELPAKAFSPFKQLVSLDLSKNNITTLSSDTFSGLKVLQTLFLFGNQISELPDGVFNGLSSLSILLLNANRLSCIKNDSFTDLSNLNLLSLYDNNIEYLPDGIFDSLNNIKTLHLGRNPFICDCNLKWLARYLEARPTLETSEARCESPKRAVRKRIQQLSPDRFRCHEPDEWRTCPCSSASVVRCSRHRLKVMPRYMDPLSTELYMDVNDIGRVSPHVNQLSQLTRLDLSNNQISLLEDNIFGNLSELQTLILSYNKLQCIQSGAFRGLKKLRVLSLHGNDISMLPEGSFMDLISISHVAMGANPLYCDCNLRWLAKWIQRDFIEGGIARCHEPRAMRDKLIMSAPASHFLCAEDPDPQILAKCDSCYSFPCANGASCQARPLRAYTCQCAPGFYGDHCEYKIDACFGQPCENQGTCKVMEAGRFNCHCSPGFDGDRCQHNIDDCLANKCENNGTCIDQIDSYRCHCQPGYSGDYCETKIQFCSAAGTSSGHHQQQQQPCKNGGHCVDHRSHYQCLCQPGYAGQNCTDNVDDCGRDHMCQNGATCVDGLNAYRCDCPVGFSGKYCELEPMVEMYPQQTSPCQQHDCTKYGVCFQPISGSSDYVCKCTAGYTGRRCEQLSAVTFRQPDSYLELDSVSKSILPMLNLTFRLATQRESGVVLYLVGTDSQHMAVELFRGRLRISLDVGNYPVSTMFSYSTVNDGRWHHVELVLVKKNITMRVDGGPGRTIVNEGTREHLDVKQQPLFIGGIPADVAAIAVKNWHLWNQSSLEGCMREIYINGLAPDLNSARRQHHIQTGGGSGGGSCPSFDDHLTHLASGHHHNPYGYIDDSSTSASTAAAAASATATSSKVCANNQCQNGKCVPKLSSKRGDKAHYQCKCHPGWTGQYCDEEKSMGTVAAAAAAAALSGSGTGSCQKSVKRDYLYDEESGCRSTKKLKLAHCTGTCSSSTGAGGGDGNCCKPLKSKHRTVRMACSDGSKYTKDVEIVRKCGCSSGRKC
ncbi:protein slit-like [Oppia nitens]|uniref:protein slit-like n=1 Tax=Oppia nitens TaxID=1686743 RepID=UPI0023DAB96B|nr:protein slit-like [Oppia nitens]